MPDLQRIGVWLDKELEQQILIEAARHGLNANDVFMEIARRVLRDCNGGRKRRLVGHETFVPPEFKLEYERAVGHNRKYGEAVSPERIGQGILLEIRDGRFRGAPR
jgi:hypothetical protein